MIKALPNVHLSVKTQIYCVYLFLLMRKPLKEIGAFNQGFAGMECFWVLNYSYLITKCIDPSWLGSCYTYNDLVLSIMRFFLWEICTLIALSLWPKKCWLTYFNFIAGALILQVHFSDFLVSSA